tara:strand:- start:46 stop:210 length:165 start_codon:yes stop_codon:yes gene_type:complete
MNEKLEMLNGCEINSWEHEGVVGINGEFGFVNGEKFKLSEEDVNILFNVLIGEL